MVVEGHLSILQSHVHVWNGAKAADAFIGTPDLSGADLSGADLKGVDFSGVNLRGANLSGANLYKADLIAADLSGANLSYAVLAKAQALETNLTGAILTGACIEDWNINGNTKLDAVVCEYIYLKSDQRDRCPNQDSFLPGDFFKLFQKTLNTISMILRNPSWEAFAYSFRKIQIENEGEELAIRSIESKGDGVVVVRVNVLSNADKGKIYSSLVQTYESMYNLLITQYEFRIQDKDKEINRLFYLLNQASEKLGEVPKVMAENARNIYTEGGNYIEYNSGTYIQGDYINMSQDLTQVAAQIQDLVEQQQKQGVTVDVAKQQVADDLATQAKSNPTIREKLIKWVQEAAGKAVVTEVVKEVLKGAATSVGIHWP